MVRTIGGGMKRWFRWVDYKRQAPASGAPLEERVYQVRYDPCRTARIALVASGDSKRWLVATEGTKPGDIIRTSGDIPRIPGGCSPTPFRSSHLFRIGFGWGFRLSFCEPRIIRP